MKRKLLVCAIAQTCILGSADGSSYTWQEGAGRLAYSVFNLSGSGCNMDPYTAGANGYAPSGSPAQAVGWNSSDSVLSFFLNPLTGFWDPDPINPPNQSQTGTLIPAFASTQTFETSRDWTAGGNAIAIADSWVVPCSGPESTSSSVSYVVMANMASAGSGISSVSIDNSQIDPPLTASDSNPVGAGFVNSANAVFNFNVDSGASYYQATGGLWSGLQSSTMNRPTSFPAVNAISAAMYPINLASYTASESSSDVWTNYNPIFGGAFTLAIGDPFIVSSFNAKILWLLAASINSPSDNPGFQWNDSSFPFSTDTSLSAGNQLIEAALKGKCPSCTAGVFGTSSNAGSYSSWLMHAPYQAAYEVVQSFTAASQPTLTFWGKLFEGLWTVTATALDAAAAVMTGGESVAVQVAVTTAVVSTTGGLTPVVDNGITNTFSQPTPTWATAPLVVNPTYSASNLLGLLLANYAVQSWVQVLGDQPFNSYANPLWANFSIYTEGLCDASTLSVSDNLFSLSITCPNLEQSSLSPPPTYNNVYTTAGSNSSQLNIWDAILTGSNVTVATNQASSSTEANGMLVLANPLTATFQPPSQIASGTDGDTYSAVTTNFNLNTGYLTLTEATAYTTPPSEQPTINPYTASYGGGDCSTLTYTPTEISYDSATGILSVANWQSGCTAQPNVDQGVSSSWSASLNLATCASGSAVNYLAPGGDWKYGPSSVSLECASPGVTMQANAALNYNQCVSDINATGGVVAMPINGSPGLACVCIPEYINGTDSSNQLTTGVSTEPNSGPCPTP